MKRTQPERIFRLAISAVAIVFLTFAACGDPSQPTANLEPATEDHSDQTTDSPIDQDRNTSEPAPSNPTTQRADSSAPADQASQADGSTEDQTGTPAKSNEEGYFDEDWKPAERKAEDEIQTIDIPDSWHRLGKKGVHEIWMDKEKKEVICAGYICQTIGGLEMFACPRGTKEHESVVAVNARASQVHATLLAMGVDPGEPVQWTPRYVSVAGPVIEVTVMWKDKKTDKIIRRNAKEMVINYETKKPMEQDWVFGGSQTYEYDDGTTVYYGDSGELLCLSNFSTATMDVALKSTDADSGLLFGANPDKIPDPGTKIYLVMRPTGEIAKAMMGPEEEPSEDDGTNAVEDSNSDSEEETTTDSTVVEEKPEGDNDKN